MKHSCFWLVLVIGFFLVTACNPGPPPAAQPSPAAKVAAPATGSQEWQTQWAKLVAGARKEGQLMIYATPSGDVMRIVAGAFQEKHGIKVEFIVGRGEELAKRMLAEEKAGLYLADVVMSGGTTHTVVMKPQGLLEDLGILLVLPEVKDPGGWRSGKVPFLDKDRTSIRMGATMQRYLLRNADLVGAEEIKSYKDLLNPKWKGKMVINDPSIPGAGGAWATNLAVDVWGMENTLAFMRQLVQQEVVLTRDTRMQVEWVARGKYALAIAPMMEQVAAFMKVGSPVALIKTLEGGRITAGIGGLAVSKKRAHPDATAVFINWLLSREGQTVFVKAFGYPSTRADVSTEGVLSILIPEPGEKASEDSEELTLYQSEVMQRMREIFAPLLK